MNLLRIRHMACLCFLVTALLTATRPLPAQSEADNAAKLVGLLKADGYDYRTTNSPTVFVVHFTGTHIQDIKVVLALSDDGDTGLVIFVTVVEKRRMPVTADFRYTLLKANNEFDQVKVGFDTDDDLSVRIDGSMRVADAQYLKGLVTQVKKSSDELYGKIEPSLLP